MLKDLEIQASLSAEILLERFARAAHCTARKKTFVFASNVYNTELDFTKYVQEPSDTVIQRQK